MEKSSIPGLDPEKVARLVGVALSHEHDEMLDGDAAIGERLRACLEDAPWTEDRKQKVWPRAIGRLLGPRRPETDGSVADLLFNPHATLAAIKDIRRHAKEKAARADDDVEHAVMTTIYFGAIANRLVFHDQRITTYSYESLRSSFGKLRSKGWMPADLAGLFEKAEQACRNKA